MTLFQWVIYFCRVQSYKIKDSNHLVMNLEKIYSEKEKTNRELFDRGYPAPSKAYELVKDTSFHIQE